MREKENSVTSISYVVTSDDESNIRLNNLQYVIIIITIIIIIVIIITVITIVIIIILITLFQEDNIFGTNASLTYGRQLHYL